MRWARRIGSFGTSPNTIPNQYLGLIGCIIVSRMVPEIRYEACWTERDGLYSCGCEHMTIADALRCMVPDGRSFVRAVQDGITRSLDDQEMKEFMAELGKVAGR